MSQLDKLIKTIKSLQAKARDKSVTVEEAAAFSQKAAELMQKYAVSEEALKERLRTDINKTIWEGKYHTDVWRKWIFCQAAPNFSCRALANSRKILVTKRNGELGTRNVVDYLIIGRKRNAEILISVLEPIFDMIVKMGHEFSTVRAHQLNFMKGAGFTVSERFAEMNKNITQCNALVVIEQELQEIDLWVDQMMNVVDAKARPVNRSFGYSQGRDAGKMIPITQLIDDTKHIEVE